MGSRGRDEKRLLAALRQPRHGAAQGAPHAAADRPADRQAAEALVAATWRQTYAAVFRLTGGDAELAADLTQEAYRKAWAALPSFDGRSRFGTWLYRIAYTTFLNHARRPRPVVALEPPPMRDGEDEAAALDRDGGHPDPSPLPDQSLAERRSSERLRRAVLALPEDLRYTVTARYWSDLSARDIADQEGVTATAVRKRLRKANTLLAATLAAAETTPEEIDR